MALVSRVEVSLPPSTLPALSSAFWTTSSLETPGTKDAVSNWWFKGSMMASMSSVLTGSGSGNANVVSRTAAKRAASPAAIIQRLIM